MKEVENCEDIRFQDPVRQGLLGKTGMFWMSFLDDSRMVFLLMCAVKTNNLCLFHKTMGDMGELFLSFDGPNYALLKITTS